MPTRRLAPLLGILLGTLPLVLPGAAAAVPPCQDESSFTTATLHLVLDGIRNQAWHEGNGLDGLQSRECHANGLIHPPDRFLAELIPHDLGVLGVCNNVAVHQCV